MNGKELAVRLVTTGVVLGAGFLGAVRAREVNAQEKLCPEGTTFTCSYGRTDRTPLGKPACVGFPAYSGEGPGPIVFIPLYDDDADRLCGYDLDAIRENL